MDTIRSIDQTINLLSFFKDFPEIKPSKKQELTSAIAILEEIRKALKETKSLG